MHDKQNSFQQRNLYENAIEDLGERMSRLLFSFEHDDTLGAVTGGTPAIEDAAPVPQVNAPTEVHLLFFSLHVGCVHRLYTWLVFFL